MQNSQFLVWSYGVWSYDLPVVAKTIKIRGLADTRESVAPYRVAPWRLILVALLKQGLKLLFHTIGEE